jgi:predicted RNA-binding protein YlqC (UPF0109 family)
MSFRGLPTADLARAIRDYLLDALDPFAGDLMSEPGNDLVVEVHPGLVVVRILGDRTWAGRVLGTGGSTADALRHLIVRATGAATVAFTRADGETT